MSFAHPPTPAARAAGTAPRLQLQTRRPRPDAVVLHAAGEIDEATVAGLGHLLLPRLVAAVRVVVVDLTGVEFLSVAGLELLGHAQLRATEHGLTLRVVATSHPVCRALAVAGLDQQPPCHTTVDAALAAGGPT